ncbi:PREDICTED: protein sidekick-2 [Crocodylus porosus]|uniref:protein sidekick-2 n=1 Tax=Crocodylus porosus TaxID=8502 RepID=UPI00093A31D6|nr:PREDICTED: protein sidekick-2 [Crocodylus porosus]
MQDAGPEWGSVPRSPPHPCPGACLADDVSPYFKTEPARSQVHLEGNRLVLTCMAEGSWPLEFKWLHNGRELTKFSLEYRYMITSLDRTHAGFYRCIVRNRMGALLQRQTEVQVAYMGSFEDGEARQSVSHGEAAVIRAPHIASFPQPQVTWFRDGRKIPPSSRIAITLDNTLVILSTVAPDAGRYYVQAVNDKNGDNKTSQPIALTVENVGGPADPIAPTIIIPPRNTSVVAGTSEVTMECVANARPLIKLHIVWKKDGAAVSGSISDYNRRLTILNPALSDSGYYECEAVLRSSSVPSVSRGAYLSVLEPPQFVKEPEKHVTAEMETVVVIPCQARGVPPPAMAWYKDAAPIHLEKLSRFRLQPDGSLQISGLVPDDTGMFQCFAHNDAGEVQTSTYLAVTSIAPNITRGPQDSTVIDGMSAILTCETSGAPRPAITWQKGERILASGSVQLPRFTLLESGSLLISPTHIADVGSYTCLATNSRGVDEASADLVVWARTRITAPPQDQSVIKGTKASLSCGVTHDPSVTIRHIWEKDGAPISVDSVPRVRLDGDGTLHISQTWSGDIGTYTCKVVSVGGNDSRSAHLRVRSAGLGVYSMKVTEWTLQGVPTVPPGNVQAEATNSTTVRFTWNPPSPQFINGINQGYKLIAWEPEQEEEATVVTVRPNFQDSIHVGYVVGLKKFAEYFTSVLCFTTPGDGPRSPPQLVRTHEDVPGPVGHLSFSDILDTSLKVSWQEPVEKNGILTGYRISWEEYNRTNTRVTHYLPNVTLEYRVTGLTALTTYTIEVAAMTSKGQGQVSSSTISSGVPPELPGAPTNLGISNISPRSVTLQFRPGYDGKTSISRWQVEAQVGQVGESEEWVLVHQLANEPDSRSMEVPGLNPYTYYSFRMRQVNIVGTSPPSLPSRRIQTLQAPPDVAPANVTLRTASETSLWLRWMPLPEQEYNGSPESVGYRVRYARSDGRGRTALHAIHDRVEREFTIEDLEEWTEYQVQVQAFNAIGAGPWSRVVAGRTRESVPSSGPANVSALATTSSSMLVRWTEIPEADRNGLILGYKVVYKEKDSDLRARFWLAEGNASRSAQLAGLGKYVLYEIRVLAFTRIGDGVPSHPPILERTLDDVPGPPVGILFPEVRTTSVRLIWQPPAAPNGIILAYQITHRLNTTNANTATVEVLNPSARQYTALGLRPESTYLFRITAQTRKGWGEAAEALVVTTEKRDRPQPPSKPAVPQEEVKARSVLLSWEPGSDGLSPVRYYTVQTRELPAGEWSLHSASVSHNTTSFVVDRLKPFTSYKFRVKATNDIGDSAYSEASESLTTLQAAPEEAPTILSVTPHTTTSVLLRWQPPAEDKINGILLGFRLRYRELAYDGLRGFTLRSIGNPGARWTELTPVYAVRNLSDASLTQYELDNLSKHQRYELRMSVYNAVGEGPPSAPQEVFVGEAVPTAAPQNVAVQAATATQLDVTWEPPPPEAQNGDIQGYKIYFWEAQRANETERVKTLFLPESGVKLKNLTGYTAYLVSVAAFNAAGDGPRSPPAKARTQQAAPSAPSAIRFSELTTTSVNVSWEPPLLPNGILEGYRLVYEPCMPVDGVSKIVTVDVKGSSPLWMKVKDLAEGVTYRFRIRAKTFAYGPEIEANITTGPGEGAPGPPGEPFISRYGSAITIHWSSGDPGKGPITRYVIEARPSDEGLWDILIKDIPKEVTSYTFSLDILKQGVSYDFRVIAVNDYGYGTPSAPSPAVSAQKANPFYEEWWFLVVIALVGLIFILLLVFVLIIRGQSKKYAKKSDSGSNPKSAALSHGEMVSLDEGSFPALELNSRRLSVKNSFCRKNGIYTRSPPRPSPGSLHYSDEDVTKYNDLIPAESSSLTEKPSEISDSQGSDSEYEVDPNPQKAHSFVNHYISDPTYYNSWRRQQKGISRAQAYSYTESDSGDPDHCPLSNSNSTQQGSLFRPKASRTPTPQTPVNPPSQQSTLYRPPSSLAPGSRAPIAGFSSFV